MLCKIRHSLDWNFMVKNSAHFSIYVTDEPRQNFCESDKNITIHFVLLAAVHALREG